MCENALNCTTSILEIIGKIINPAFKENGLPQITLRIGLDFGEALVVLTRGEDCQAWVLVMGMKKLW